MAINTVVTAGFGNGTFAGTIPLVVLRGYAIGEEIPSVAISGRFDINMPPQDRLIMHPFEDRTILAPPKSRKLKL